MREMRQHFRPEFLNRVDDIVVFRPLSRDDIGLIVDIQLRSLTQQLEKRHLTLQVTPAAKQLVAARGYDPVYGARPLKRVIQHDLQNPIALDLLEGLYQEGDVILVEPDGEGGLRFSRQPKAAEAVSA